MDKPKFCHDGEKLLPCLFGHVVENRAAEMSLKKLPISLQIRDLYSHSRHSCKRSDLCSL